MQTKNPDTELFDALERDKKAGPSFKVAFVLWLVASAACFAVVIHQEVGLHRFFRLSSLPILAQHPQAVMEYIAEALGASTVFPALHVALFSMSAAKRNPSTRRRIFIGWSLFIIALQLYTVFKAAPKLPY
jgi:hypothetical protein